MVEQHPILLVEDDATIREMTQLSLERDGFVVDTAADGPAGPGRVPCRQPSTWCCWT